MHVYECADSREVEQPLGVLGAQVDAAIAHGAPEIVMPVGAVQAIATIIIHGIGNIFQVVAGPSHVGFGKFDIDAKLSWQGWCAG